MTGRNWFCERCKDIGIVGFWLWKRVCPVCRGYPERYWRLQHSPLNAEIDEIWAEKKKDGRERYVV